MQAKIFMDITNVLVWFVSRIYVASAIFEPYGDLEAGDNQSLKSQVARLGIKPRFSWSASQELNHSATAAPKRNVDLVWQSLQIHM